MEYFLSDRAVLHLMRESIIPSYQCFQLKHGSPFLPYVNKLLRHLQEGGILDFWLRRTIHQALTEGVLVPYEDYKEVTFSPRILDLKRSYPAFLVLATGYMLAFIVFILELLYKIVDDYMFMKKHPFIN